MPITCAQLKEKLEKKEDVFLLDARTPEEYKSWSIKGSVNIPMQSIQNNTGLIPKEKEIITICAHGQRSQYVAAFLKSKGFNVDSVQGGMASWNAVYDFVPLVEGSVKVFHVKRVGKGCLGYFVVSGGQATVIDPSTHTGEYVNFAKNLGCEIKAIIDTHQHADHLSGSRLLQDSTGAALFLNQLDRYSFQGYKDLMENKTIAFAETEIKAIHTPGHTKGSTSFLVGDEIILTGDTLFIDGVARPDLADKAGD